MILVSEVFGVTIQGEGSTVGLPTVFIRTGGCQFRCRWCDSLHAVLPKYRHEWKQYTPTMLRDEVEKITGGQPILITLSGGNPALQDLGNFIDLMKDDGYTFAMETQGSVYKDWFGKLDYLTLSPKPPSSGMNDPKYLDRLKECVMRTPSNVNMSLKIVVLSEDDYQFAKRLYTEYPHIDMYLSVCNPNPPNSDYGDGTFDVQGITDATEWLIGRYREDLEWWCEHTMTRYSNSRLRILPQVHTLLWGNKQGV